MPLVGLLVLGMLTNVGALNLFSTPRQRLDLLQQQHESMEMVEGLGLLTSVKVLAWTWEPGPWCHRRAGHKQQQQPFSSFSSFLCSTSPLLHFNSQASHSVHCLGIFIEVQKSLMVPHLRASNRASLKSYPHFFLSPSLYCRSVMTMSQGYEKKMGLNYRTQTHTGVFVSIHQVINSTLIKMSSYYNTPNLVQLKTRSKLL